ncbi:MAG: histidine--tRNA ligase, partial [Deltaproteobacteria bacterium]
FSYEQKSLKAQMKLANRLNAAFTAIIGEDDLKLKEIVLRNMRSKEQTPLPLDESLAEKIVAAIEAA